jgi:NAD+ diphosphatase
MKIAEQVTFGGSGLDRAAQDRADPKRQAALRSDPAARALALWRGKPMVLGQEHTQAAWLPLDSAVFSHGSDWVFLGQDEAGPRFAIDVSSWQPPEMPETLNQFLDPSQQRHPSVPDDHVFAELRSVMTRLSPRDAELIATARGILEWLRSHGFCANCGAKSEIDQAGWQRTCPSCGRHHFPRTDPVVIMLITRGNSVLMGRSPGWPEGMFSLLAGFVEPGETIEAAVRRETFEEAGVRVGEVGYLASQPWPFPASLMFGCWGHATSDEIQIDPNEIEDARWVTREEMLDVFAGNSQAMKPARRGAIAHFLIWNWLRDQLD